MRLQFAERLDGEALTTRALVDVAQLAGTFLTDNLTGEDSHKHSHVEVDTETEEGHDVSPVPCGGIKLAKLKQTFKTKTDLLA